ncbi:MAG: oxygen-independent coproporphyrinogen III oxidase [Alphaproteobacteria bacterium]
MPATPEILVKYDTRVPRYTSYPTAPHFTPAVGTDVYRTWLGEIGDSAALSLYLHVPFCSKLCWYCGCHTTIVHGYEPVLAYRDLLLREIDLAADAMRARPRVVHIHWGGGTPTILKGPDFVAVIERIRRRFEGAAEAETAVETDPRCLSPEMIEAMGQAGVTRASLGVQDFRREVQVAVNRIQSFEQTAHAVAQLRAAGVHDINIDLIYGLPHQTAETVIETVDLTVSLRPERLALFGYAHVPWMKRHQRLLDESTLPDTAERWAMYEAARGRLAHHGYVPVGLDHFAAPGTGLARAVAAGALHRNFQGYTADSADTLIGFGASAIGTLPQGYVQNAVPISAYREAITEGRLAVVRGIAIGPDDRLRRAVIERIMCDLEVDVGAVCRECGFDAGALDSEIASLADFVADGLVAIDGRTVRIKEEGRPLVRSVAAAFDAYLGQGEARHSKAV